MKAMLFAAGLGTRLRPLTDSVPKALVPVAGQPLLERSLLNLKRQGFQEVVVNVHHFHQQIVQFLKEKENFGLTIHLSDESGLLLDTGGGLKKAKLWLEGKEPFLLMNADILTDLDLQKMIRRHQKDSVIATLAVRNRETSRYFLFDEGMNLCGWENVSTGEKRITHQRESKRYAFSGIHIVTPEIFSMLPEEDVFSINQVYLNIAESKVIRGYLHSNDYWFDIGKPETLAAAEKYLSAHE